MTHTSGPRPDDPLLLPLTYPPGFEPSAADEPGDQRAAAGPVSPGALRPTVRKPVGRRPVMAGFLGTALVTLIGFSGGLLAAPAVSVLGGHQSVSQGASAPGTTASRTAPLRTTASGTGALNPLAPPQEDGADG